ncbi:MAG TPA: tetratricopeptide repeat protein, partial [Chthoniobacterales bacterium]
MRALIFLLLCGPLALAAEPVLERARETLAKGWSSAVLLELDDKTLNALPADSQREALLLRARAQLQSGNPEAAQTTLRDARLADFPAARLLRGDAFFAEKNYESARRAYAEAGGGPAALGEARSLRALGRGQEAVAVLSAIPLKSEAGRDAALERAAIWLEWKKDSPVRELVPQMEAAFPGPDARIQYLRGVLDWRAGKLEAARASLSEAARDEGETGALAVLALSEVEAASGDPAGAEDVLEDYLRRSQGSRLLLRVLENLDALYERGSSWSSDLRAVAEDQSNPVRARMAGYFLARNEARLGRTDTAKRTYEKFIANSPDEALKQRAVEEYADLLIRTQAFDPAVALLQDPAVARNPRMRIKLAEVFAAQGRYPEAEKEYLTAAGDASLGEAAAANAAYCALLAGQPAAENAGLRILRETHPSSPRIAEVELWLARDAARCRGAEAPAQLQQLARTGNPEAALHLAEWRFIENDPAESARELARANLSGADGERAAYLAVFLTDQGSEENSDRALLLAEDFIKRYPQSAYLPEVEFKRAEVLFRSGDYQTARMAFAKLAADYPASPLAGRAWLQAGLAGMKLMNRPALERSREDLEEAAKSDPSLAALARFHR